MADYSARSFIVSVFISATISRELLRTCNMFILTQMED